MRAVKEMGYEVGLHTGGSYPARLAEVLPDLSWVGLDVKAVPADGAHWAKVTGVESAQDKWTESLGLLLASGVPFECRTTAHPDYFSEAQLLETAAFLRARNVKDYALQICRKPPWIPHGPPNPCLRSSARDSSASRSGGTEPRPSNGAIPPV